MKVETIVFLSLVLDLFAFTIPLPLFPRLIEWYTVREAGDPDGLLARTIEVVSTIRAYLYHPPDSAAHHSRKWDIVLLGGLMGSVFSTLQFFVSPSIGSLSDRYGRKTVLLWSMIGNILSAFIWLTSTRFSMYMLSRVVGGLSEGNVQLAIAILSDITTPATRSKTLAQVGIAFAICFIIGPPIGAYFASRPLPLPSFLNPYNVELNIYATPAMITLVLVSVETIFLYGFLPETKGYKAPAAQTEAAQKEAKEVKKSTKIASERLKILGSLRLLHFLFLGIFSGVEFTLTFLTFDLFDWSNTQNGSLIGTIGIISALLQGGYVRRSISRVGEAPMARRGILVCSIGFGLLCLLSTFASQGDFKTAKNLLWASAVCFAFTSATVVNSLTACASLMCDEDSGKGDKTVLEPQLAKGRALGKFRSSGQLGRAIGPIIACASYWTFGPAVTYGTAASSMALLTVVVGIILPV